MKVNTPMSPAIAHEPIKPNARHASSTTNAAGEIAGKDEGKPGVAAKPADRVPPGLERVQARLQATPAENLTAGQANALEHIGLNLARYRERHGNAGDGTTPVTAPIDPPAPVVETPIVETPVVEAPVVEVPVVEAPVVEAPVVETPVVEAPVVEAPVVEAPVVEAPVVEAPVVEAPVVEAPVVEAPVVEAPVVEAPVVEAPVVEAPVAEAPIIEAPAIEGPIVEATPPGDAALVAALVQAVDTVSPQAPESPATPIPPAGSFVDVQA